MMEERYLFQNGFLAEKNGEDAVTLLRAYGTSPELAVPEQIGGYPVTEIGAYCFARSAHLTKEAEALIEEARAKEPSLASGEICGENLSVLELPDAIRKIGDCTFYNCKNLSELIVGKAVEELGSDVFMNCVSLKKLKIRGSVLEKSGLKQLLSRISFTVEVFFENGTKTEAAVLYPEFFETYDEIAPAHLFGRNITGEGFRARQCFRDGKIAFAEYDAIFPKICVEESRDITGQFALDRLFYPVELSRESRLLYEGYLNEQQEHIGKRLVRDARLEVLHFMCEKKYFSKETLLVLLEEAVVADWTEGAASLMAWKKEYYETAKGARYTFDDF